MGKGSVGKEEKGMRERMGKEWGRRRKRGNVGGRGGGE